MEQKEPTLGNGGFEEEGERVSQPDNSPPPKKAAPASKSDQLATNFKSVFGHGIGKFAIIVVVVVVVVFVAFALRGMNADKPQESVAKIDVPNAPKAQITVDPIDAKEEQRRVERARLEADEAAKKGQTYQPGFDPNVHAMKNGQAGTQQPDLGFSNTEAPKEEKPVAAASPQNQADDQRQQTEAAKKREAELQKAVDARDKYVAGINTEVGKRVEELFGSPGKPGGLRGSGQFTFAAYGQGAQADSKPTGATADAAAGSATGKLVKKPIFKAGRTLFATTDAEVNTDDGGAVFATIRGGEWDGSKLIGKIEQASNNIRVTFSTLAPQDSRPTMRISAIAIREEDAKQGVAENIDEHTISRYAHLFVGSVFSGLGKAAQVTQGETVVTATGQVYTTQPKPDSQRIAMFAAGEMGNGMGSEVRRGFNRPTTYSIPPNQGIGIIFLSDVTDQQQ